MCAKLSIPVMAHTSESMGADAIHDELGGPSGWRALVSRFGGRMTPIVSLGHFGGDGPNNQWTMELAELMDSPGGETLYADVAYWDKLVCESSKPCPGLSRISEAVDKHAIVADRVMYGSDWFMLSRAHDWKAFPFNVAWTTRGTKIDRDKLFAENAKRCFNL